ncbi:MAG: heme exporter protein CcmD [Alphaproteobacteria bacterium]|nr:heme exporter protein CcmD [Alphaproteobacteria bacterium]
MEKLTEVLAMGGYAHFVWPSYLIAALVIATLLALSMRQHKRTREQLAKLEDSRSDES